MVIIPSGFIMESTVAVWPGIRSFKRLGVMTPQNVEVTWEDDNIAVINVYKQSDEGDRVINKSIRLDTSD
ncbi:hypothetical protein [Niallia taxi]|uniref:hypothetical protein n=1 Tax=Niallia taxi TaxID=2499688 RepID=UPI0011A6D76B|nr:hypothetical protein [Niallia taxi]MDE5051680.1 hypothetical protein [Niallia taxi]